MSEHTPHQQSDGINEKVDQLKETVTEQGQKVFSVVAETNTKVDVMKVVQTVAIVGILLTNRKSLKLAKHVIKMNDKNILATANTIKQLKNAGQTFEFFPGIGVWVD